MDGKIERKNERKKLRGNPRLKGGVLKCILRE
jgi:hypothetical protein